MYSPDGYLRDYVDKQGQSTDNLATVGTYFVSFGGRINPIVGLERVALLPCVENQL